MPTVESYDIYRPQERQSLTPSSPNSSEQLVKVELQYGQSMSIARAQRRNTDAKTESKFTKERGPKKKKNQRTETMYLP